MEEAVKVYAEPGCELYKKIDTDAGFDLRAKEGKVIKPGQVKKFDTGIRVEMPLNIKGKVTPRSGLSAKHGLVAVEGTIDPEFRGEIGVILINEGYQSYVVEQGDRIAQLEFEYIPQVTIQYVNSPEELSDTTRGEGGFGHTGVT